MTFKEYQKITNEYLKDILKMGERKGIEYANSDDRLDNFKRISKQIGIEPEIVAITYAAKHWDSVNHAIKIQDYCNIDGRIADLINYLLLLRAIIIEGEQT